MDPRARFPQPGDFDEFLVSIDPDDPEFVERHEGGAGVKLQLAVWMDRKDAARLKELAARRGQEPSEVIAELVRNA